MHNLKNKKGDIPSLIILVVLVAALAIGVVVFNYAFTQITGELKEMPEFSNQTVETIETVESSSAGYLDYFIFFCFIGLFIGIIISSIYVDVHPALAIIFIILLVVAIVLAGIFANAYLTMIEMEQLVDTAAEFPMTYLIINNLPLFLLVVGAIVIIILYGKSRGGGVPL